METDRQRIQQILLNEPVEITTGAYASVEFPKRGETVDQLLTLLTEARIEEVGRLAPHQMAQYFAIPQSELNASWCLDYAKQRRSELQASLRKADQ